MTNPMQIPDAAVQAAMDATSGNIPPVMLESALTAALPHLPLGYEAKKLEWVQDEHGSIEFTAQSMFGEYSVYIKRKSAYACSLDGVTYERIKINHPYTVEQAIAAAQADFERRVRECHVPVSITKSSGCVFNDLGITKPADMAAVHTCACTTIQQDEHCPVGCPSLLCDVCDGKGVLPYIKLDGAELWEIIFGIATEAAHEITDEQYSKIADHINSVFIQPESAAIRALPAVPAQGARPLEEWHEDHGNVVWWAWDNDRKTWLGEPAYIGKPLDRDWPEYHTHWTPHPTFPAAPTPEAVK